MAERLILELEESWVFGMLWPKRLLIFEDRVETRSTELLRETVEAAEYEEIEDLVVGGGAWSTNLLIRRRRDKPILIRGVDEDTASRAKVLIEERMARLADEPDHPQASETPRLLRKLADLRNAGVLTEQEFEAKRRELERREI